MSFYTQQPRGVPINHFLLGDPANPLMDWLMKGYTPHIITTCCALPNFCENEKECVNPIWTEEAATRALDIPQPGVRAFNTSDNATGQDHLDYLSANFPLRQRYF